MTNPLRPAHKPHGLKNHAGHPAFHSTGSVRFGELFVFPRPTGGRNTDDYLCGWDTPHSTEALAFPSAFLYNESHTNNRTHLTA